MSFSIIHCFRIILIIVICSLPTYMYANTYISSNFACSLPNGRVTFIPWKTDGLIISGFSWASNIHGFTKFWKILYFWVNQIQQNWEYTDSYLYAYSCKYHTVKKMSFIHRDTSLNSEIFLEPSTIPGIYIVYWWVIWWGWISLWVFDSQKNQYFPIFETEQYLSLYFNCDLWECHFELSKRKWKIYMEWFDWKGAKQIFLLDLAGLKLIPQKL